MDYQTYLTYAEAKMALSELEGWTWAKVEKVHLPNDPKANIAGDTYVLQCAPGQYMRTDGYVR